MTNPLEGSWALVLGASSGFGGASATELARNGVNIAGVHLDRKATLPNAEAIQQQVREAGRECLFFNVNAVDPEKRQAVLDAICEKAGTDAPVRILFHSLAFGSLGRYFPEDGKGVTDRQMNMSLEVMAHSLVYWVQDLVDRGLIGKGGRVFAMTSSGGHRVWPSYGPVSAAKAALESHVRQIALELAPRGITANAIQAGVTDTPALRKIPGNEEMVANASRCNPSGRLTTPEDVARCLIALSYPHTQWVTGNVIRVDGGEDITG